MKNKIIFSLIIVVILVSVPVSAANEVNFNNQNANNSVVVNSTDYDGSGYVIVIEDNNRQVWGNSTDLSAEKSDITIQLNQNITDDVDLTAKLYQTSTSDNFGSALADENGDDIKDSAIISPSSDSGGSSGGSGILPGLGFGLGLGLDGSEQFILLLILAFLLLLVLARS